MKINEISYDNLVEKHKISLRCLLTLRGMFVNFNMICFKENIIKQY